nr:glutathione peroxidase [uncultured Flavobacterium sp.]
MNEFYKLSAITLQGNLFSFENLRGKTVVIVNTASKCGFTPQYDGLEILYQKYKDQGLVILGFPCNQFLKQEPGDVSSIDGCLINYGVSFPIFEKIDVNGSNTHPVFKFLKKNLSGIFGNFIKWNFTKFVIDKNGNPVKRFAPITKPEEMENYIKSIL